MKDILRPRHRRTLEEFGLSNVLVAFDFDGTLAPIVTFPDRAKMRAKTARLLADLAALYPCAVISGRARADVKKRLNGIPVQAVVGNHGAEPWHGSARLLQRVRRWRPLLDRQVSRFRGVRIEDKGFSITVHYRLARDKKKAKAAILEAAGALADARTILGAHGVHVLGKRAPDKGSALERERERLGCRTAIYVGDDDTDEDVFGLDRPSRLLTIRVGSKRVSGASYFIRRQADVDELLRVLVEARRRDLRRRRHPEGPREGGEARRDIPHNTDFRGPGARRRVRRHVPRSPGRARRTSRSVE